MSAAQHVATRILNLQKDAASCGRIKPTAGNPIVSIAKQYANQATNTPTVIPTATNTGQHESQPDVPTQILFTHPSHTSQPGQCRHHQNLCAIHDGNGGFVCKHQGTVLNGMFDPATTTCEHGQDLCYVFDRDRGGNVCRYTGTYLPDEQEIVQTSDTSYDSQPPQVQCDHDRSKCDAGWYTTTANVSYPGCIIEWNRVIPDYTVMQTTCPAAPANMVTVATETDLLMSCGQPPQTPPPVSSGRVYTVCHHSDHFCDEGWGVIDGVEVPLCWGGKVPGATMFSTSPASSSSGPGQVGRSPSRSPMRSPSPASVQVKREPQPRKSPQLQDPLTAEDIEADILLQMFTLEASNAQADSCMAFMEEARATRPTLPSYLLVDSEAGVPVCNNVDLMAGDMRLFAPGTGPILRGAFRGMRVRAMGIGTMKAFVQAWVEEENKFVTLQLKFPGTLLVPTARMCLVGIKDITHTHCPQHASTWDNNRVLFGEDGSNRVIVKNKYRIELVCPPVGQYAFKLL